MLPEKTPSPLTVWAVSPVLIHRTVAPGAAMTCSGRNPKSNASIRSWVGARAGRLTALPHAVRPTPATAETARTRSIFVSLKSALHELWSAPYRLGANHYAVAAHVDHPGGLSSAGANPAILSGRCRRRT